ncbi:hypothetical protein VCEC0051_000236B, partial [Vibrio cholerae O1 str. EC-0051]
GKRQPYSRRGEHRTSPLF